MELENARTLIRMEYLEMPDMKLTLRQARRLFNLTDEACTSAFESLVATGFLARTSDGSFLRRSQRGLVAPLEPRKSLDLTW